MSVFSQKTIARVSRTFYSRWRGTGFLAIIKNQKNMKSKSLQILANLFQEIGWSDRFEEALQEDCRNSYLHGLCDAAYSSWASADEFVKALREETGLLPSETELWHLEQKFPYVSFRDDREWGFEYARGNLFSLRDYQIAKEAIADLGEDKFSKEFRLKYGQQAPINSHLF